MSFPPRSYWPHWKCPKVWPQDGLFSLSYWWPNNLCYLNCNLFSISLSIIISVNECEITWTVYTGAYAFKWENSGVESKLICYPETLYRHAYRWQKEEGACPWSKTIPVLPNQLLFFLFVFFSLETLNVFSGIWITASIFNSGLEVKALVWLFRKAPGDRVNNLQQHK